jgi:ferredoxin-NADP reductase
MFNIHEAKTRKQIDFQSITDKATQRLLNKMSIHEFVDFNCNSSYQCYAHEICADRLDEVISDDGEIFTKEEQELAKKLQTQLATYSVDSILMYI